MITYAQYVGVPPGTSTIQLGAPAATLTAEEYYAQDIALREKEARWQMIGAIASGALSAIAIVAAVAAWARTGHLRPPHKIG